MKNTWLITEKELSLLALLYGKETMGGLVLPSIEEGEMEQLKASCLEKKFFIKTETGYRIHRTLELILMTVSSPESRMLVSTGEKEGLCGIFFTGSSITYALRRENAYEFTWIPFLPVAFGALYGTLRDLLGKEPVIFDFGDRAGAQRLIAMPSEKKESLIDYCDRSGNAETITEEETYRRIQLLLAANYGRCVRRAYYDRI